MAEAESTQSNVGAYVGWGLLAVMTVGFIWYVSGQLGVEWDGRGQEALDLVKAYKGPNMEMPLSDQLILVSEEARKKGSFEGQFAWAATQDQGPLYKAELIWRKGSATKKAIFLVNLEDGSIKPQGPDAARFMKRVESSP